MSSAPVATAVRLGPGASYDLHLGIEKGKQMVTAWGAVSFEALPWGVWTGRLGETVLRASA
ncbi:MAG: hypothetical protein ABSF61_06770 [Anaerolineales bacterium]